MAFLNSRANIPRSLRANIPPRLRANIHHSRVNILHHSRGNILHHSRGNILHHLKVSIRRSRQRLILRLPTDNLRIGSRIRRSMLSNPMFRRKVEMRLWFQADLSYGFGSTRE